MASLLAFVHGSKVVVVALASSVDELFAAAAAGVVVVTQERCPAHADRLWLTAALLTVSLLAISTEG